MRTILGDAGGDQKLNTNLLGLNVLEDSFFCIHNLTINNKFIYQYVLSTLTIYADILYTKTCCTFLDPYIYMKPFSQLPSYIYNDHSMVW